MIELLIAVAIIGLVVSIAIPNLIGMINRGRQKRSMADLRTIATALAEYSIDNSFYPRADTEVDLGASPLPGSLVPLYSRSIPQDDGWLFPLRYQSDMSAYTVGSLGKDGGLGGSLTVVGSSGVTSNYDCDIIFSKGSFVQWPQGYQAN